MNHIKYAFSHCIGILITLYIIICLLTTNLSNIISQLQSAKNGIEIILVDVTVSMGNESQLRKNISSVTNVKHVGISSLDSASAQDYIKTVENYTMVDYLTYLALSRNAEMIIVPETMLETVYQMNIIAPLSLEIPEEYKEKCSMNDTVYAFPFRHLAVTEYDATLFSAQSEVYGILLAGADHTEALRLYLSALDS